MQEVEHLSRAELENLATMFGILPSTENNLTPDLGIARGTDEVAADIQDKNSLPTMQSEFVGDNIPNSNLVAENETREGEEHQDSLAESDSDAMKESVKSFCELVGIESRTARGYLEVLFLVQ